MTTSGFKSGYIAIIGRPNVGKSTLINRFLGLKLCITSRRPQTTRHRILGIKTQADCQLIYVDTPGLHLDDKKAMNRYMNRAAAASIDDVDVILFVVEEMQWTEEDEKVLQRLERQAHSPVILVINKVDKVADKDSLLPYIKDLSQRFDFTSVVPVSARKGQNVTHLEQEIKKWLPEGEQIFPDDQLTDRSSRFLAAELIREQLFRHLGQELPYSITVDIEQFEEQQHVYRISAVIYVERSGQKNIVIGKKGALLKSVGQASRLEMEELFGKKIFLNLWVKVREGWGDNERMLKNLGYNDMT